MLIPEAKQAWRFTSVQISALLAIIAALEIKFTLISAMIPEPYRSWGVLFFAVAAIIARLWPQPDATAKARDGKMSSLADQILELRSQLDAVGHDPEAHDDLLSRIEQKKALLEKLVKIAEITAAAKVVPTQPS